MDIGSLYNISSSAIRGVMETTRQQQETVNTQNDANGDVFASFLNSAIESINQTNGYISDAENEELRLAMGETDSTHDLTIALQKASTAIQYTVAVRDKFLESYRTIINMQI